MVIHNDWASYSGWNKSWDRYIFSNDILTFWYCACQNSKVIHVLFKFDGSFSAQILKIRKLHWKLGIKQMSVLFCNYLGNESSDLHETLYGDQLLFFELLFQISWRSVHKCAHTSCKRARARFIASARVYNLFARIKCKYIRNKSSDLH